MGLNNIELISDRPIETNFREIYEVKKRYPNNLVIASLMVESKRESWHEMVRRAEDAGSDALELNFGCPHGMSERGMGAAVGQVPEYTEMITSWVKEAAKIPVIVKLTPNVTDVTRIAEAAERGGADAVSLINTINS
jgi:dihydropyrimidine dehydrogenase (NAD+) subunit PreA